MFIQERNFGSYLAIKCGYKDGEHNSGDHLHQFCELEMVLDGEIEIGVDGVTEVARAGDIAIITPFRVHSFNTPKYVKMLICVFSESFVNDFIPLSVLCQKRASHIFHASEPLWNYLMGIEFYNTKGKIDFDPVSDANYIHRLRATFYLILSEYFSAMPVTGASNIDNTLSKILIYISENYTKNITLESVGTALGYSPKYVSACLKAIPGGAFRTLINSLRVERAKSLLLTTDESNLNVAYECGFVSQASFHRAFLEHVGTSPKKYRMSRRK